MLVGPGTVAAAYSGLQEGAMSQPTRPEARVLWASVRREPQEETDDETSRCVRARRGGGQSEILPSVW